MHLLKHSLKLKLSILFVALSILCVQQTSVLADDTNHNTYPEGIELDSVAILYTSVDKEVFSPNEKITGKFSLKNNSKHDISSLSFTTSIKEGYEISKGFDTPLTFAFLEKDKKINLKSGEEIVVPFAYEIPEGVSGKRMFLTLEVYSLEGQMLNQDYALVTVDAPKFAVSMQNFGVIVPSVSGDEIKKTDLGVTVSLVSSAPSDINSKSYFEYWNITGRDKVTVLEAQELLKSNTAKTINIKTDASSLVGGVYEGRFYVVDATTNKPVSMTVPIRFAIEKPNALIQKFDIDNTKVNKKKLDFTFLWSPIVGFEDNVEEGQTNFKVVISVHKIKGEGLGERVGIFQSPLLGNDIVDSIPLSDFDYDMIAIAQVFYGNEVVTEVVKPVFFEKPFSVWWYVLYIIMILSVLFGALMIWRKKQLRFSSIFKKISKKNTTIGMLLCAIVSSTILPQVAFGWTLLDSRYLNEYNIYAQIPGSAAKCSVNTTASNYITFGTPIPLTTIGTDGIVYPGEVLYQKATHSGWDYYLNADKRSLTTTPFLSMFINSAHALNMYFKYSWYGASTFATYLTPDAPANLPFVQTLKNVGAMTAFYYDSSQVSNNSKGATPYGRLPVINGQSTTAGSQMFRSTKDNLAEYNRKLGLYDKYQNGQLGTNPFPNGFDVYNVLTDFNLTALGITPIASSTYVGRVTVPRRVYDGSLIVDPHYGLVGIEGSANQNAITSAGGEYWIPYSSGTNKMVASVISGKAHYANSTCTFTRLQTFSEDYTIVPDSYAYIVIFNDLNSNGVMDSGEKAISNSQPGQSYQSACASKSYYPGYYSTIKDVSGFVKAKALAATSTPKRLYRNMLELKSLLNWHGIGVYEDVNYAEGPSNVNYDQSGTAYDSNLQFYRGNETIVYNSGSNYTVTVNDVDGSFETVKVSPRCNGYELGPSIYNYDLDTSPAELRAPSGSSTGSVYRMITMNPAITKYYSVGVADSSVGAGWVKTTPDVDFEIPATGGTNHVFYFGVAEVVSGQCLPSAVVTGLGQPGGSACSLGTQSPITEDTNSYSWTCAGANGGSTAQCVKNKCASGYEYCSQSNTCVLIGQCNQAGVCGTAGGQFFSSVTEITAQNACSYTGTAASPSLNEANQTYEWSCTGTGGGANTSCTASVGCSSGTTSCYGECIPSSEVCESIYDVVSLGSLLKVTPITNKEDGACVIDLSSDAEVFESVSPITHCQLLNQTQTLLNFDPAVYSNSAFTETPVKQDKLYTLKCWDGPLTATSTFEIATGTCRLNLKYEEVN